VAGKVLMFPTGDDLTDKLPNKFNIADEQTKKYADALTDDTIIQVISSLQNEGLKIGKPGYNKTFLDVGIMLEAFRALIYREMDLEHPFHDITNKLMYIEKDKGRRYSVINYAGTEIIDKKEKDDNVVEFESEIDFDNPRLQPDSDK
tara:strand:+ start:371 stop:811 length:441 start_codon:yes stop_codon:yes gene_type:complete